MSVTESIRQAARQLVRELHLLDGRHCIEGFSFSECHLLTEVERLGRATASELAALLVLEKSTVSRLVNSLRERDLLVAVEDAADRRWRHLALTPNGQAATARIHRQARKQVDDALGYMSPDEWPGVVDGLSRYAKALGYARRSEGTRLRPIQANDNPAVAGIIRDVMTEFGAVGEGYSIEDPEVDDMSGAYQGSGAGFWVVEDDDGLIGCGGFAALAGGEEDTCELRKMYFLSRARGLGLGTRLMNQILAGARSAGYAQCYLETLDSMDAARHLYLKHGFRVIDGPMGKTGHTACNRWMVADL